MKKKAAKKSWGFDPKNIDSSIRPQDDFYHFANGGWIKRHKIPADESRWGAFNILRYNTEHQLYAIVITLLKKGHKKGSPEQLIADMYRSALDMKRRNALGSKPLQPLVKKIRAIADTDSLVDTIATLHKVGIAVPWEFYLDQDSKNSARYLLHLTQDGLGMPEREYYLSAGAEQKRVRDAYLKHIEKVMRLSGRMPKEAKRAVAVILDIETKLAKASMKKEDMRDSEKTYHKWSVAKLQKGVPQVDWRRYLHTLGAGELRDINVGQPEFFKAAGKMLETVPIEDWKIYLEWHLFNEFAGLLSAPFVKENWEFYARVLTGAKKMRAPWRRALGAVNGAVGEALGKLYVERHFTKAAKRRMDELVDDLFDAYEARIKQLDWMSPQTKQRALVKLRAMNRKIGYPEKFETYSGLRIVSDDFFGNAMRAHEFYHRKAMRRLHKPVDRKEWLMTPQTVNAYCHFNLNEIVFPAAILQPPFFSLNADDAVNYGAIGSVIGHEITHGFDDQGSKFNAKGNMISWWTKVDRKRFEKKANILVNQFNQYRIGDGVKANGQLTLGENIADLGGASIALDAYRNHLRKVGDRRVGTFSPEQRFFFGFAQCEQEVARPEFKKFAALVDPHSAAEHRVNGPASNLEAFYEAFGVKKGDTLYRSPSQRAKIW